jgi:hypothetical protein
MQQLSRTIPPRGVEFEPVKSIFGSFLSCRGGETSHYHCQRPPPDTDGLYRFENALDPSLESEHLFLASFTRTSCANHRPCRSKSTLVRMTTYQDTIQHCCQGTIVHIRAEGIRPLPTETTAPRNVMRSYCSRTYSDQNRAPLLPFVLRIQVPIKFRSCWRNSDKL